MNCKPGDLAVIVRSYAGNDGKIVRCIAPFPAGTENSDPELGVVWKVDAKLRSVKKNGGAAGVSMYVPDIQLRPIRDQPGTDEMIRIAGKPNKEKVDG